MKIIAYLVLITIILTACNNSVETDATNPDSLYPAPKSFKVNPEDGYITNVVTADTIQPIILENGDTLITGVPIPAKEKTIHTDSVNKPKVVQIPKDLTVKKAHQNVHKIPNKLTVITVNQDSLIKIDIEKIAVNDTTHYLINSIGDTIKTGIPIPTQGKIVPTTQPKKTKALPLRFKDAANINMQYLDVDQGMASSYVQCVYEDKSGNLWFGTNGGGVSKYNGTSFTHFTEKEGLSSNPVWSILEDKSNQKGSSIWVTTENGLNELSWIGDDAVVSTTKNVVNSTKVTNYSKK